MDGFDETFDFVVVGSGGGSMCAGLVMKSLGKSTLILEKTDLVGGTTARSGGVMWIPNNPFMKRDGVDDSYEKANTYLDSVVGDHADSPGATRERRRAYVTEAPRMIDFLLSQGLKLTRSPYWPDYYDDRPGGSEKGRTVVAELFDLNELGAWRTKLRRGTMPVAGMLHEMLNARLFKTTWIGKKMSLRIGIRQMFAKLTGKRWATAGEALQGRMLHASIRAGLDIRVNAAVRELIVENGAVKGVVTEIDGRKRRIGARLGVLVNAGGFARNQAMRDQYQPGTSAAWTQVAPGDTGEMIQEMMRIGAAIGQMEEMVGNQLTIPPGTENDDMYPGMQLVTAAPHAILVDQSGVRYMNEGGSYMAYCKAMLERNKTVGAVPSWAVFDTQFLRTYMFGNTMPGTTNKPKAWFESGYLRKADTIEELAKLLKIDPAKLKGTVERFNGFAAKGHDEDFHRGDRAYDRWLGDMYQSAPTLAALSEAPYYAVPVYPGDVGTYGGVVTDVNARVLRADGAVIPGLYATGVSTASVMGRVYPGAGCSVGPSFTWGYVAAKHAGNASNTR